MVTLERSDPVAVIRLNNPPLNLMTKALIAQLGEVIEAVGGDPATRSVVVSGSGTRAFSAGSDIREFPNLMRDGTVVAEKLGPENVVLNQLADLPQPTVAAINGHALGGGAELTLCCDRRVMAADATMGFPEIQLGTIPGSGGLLRVPRLIGMGQALALMLDGEPISARQALDLGLVDEVVPADEVLPQALDVASRWANRPVEAARSIKRAIRATERESPATLAELSLELSEHVYGTAAMREGVKRFLERSRGN